MTPDLYRDENFSLENFNKGHYSEALDRLHMIQEHMHAALWNHEGLTVEESILVTQASDILMTVYQSVGQRIDD